MSNAYIFPFTTCETPSKHGIAQTYSFGVNLVVVLGLTYFLFKSSTKASRALILSLIIFELWHAFSHAYHIEGHVQAFVIHALAYVIALTLFLVIQSKNGIILPWLIVAMILVDIIALTCLTQKEWSVITGSLVVATLLIPFSLHLPFWIPVAFTSYFILGIVLFLLEKRYCHTWMKAYPFPYHAAVEVVVGLFLWTFAYVMTSSIHIKQK
jgi:hypothetical protein